MATLLKQLSLLPAPTQRALIAQLQNITLPERVERIDEVLAKRTAYVQLVLENVFQSHNASACLRSADCFGALHVHIVEDRNKFDPTDGIALGSSKWLHLHKYGHANATERCLQNIKNQGIRVAVTAPNASKSVFDYAFEGPVALVFGTERRGASDVCFDLADEQVSIPMVGFSESLNVSVSVAVCLSHMLPALRRSGIAWQLSEEEAVYTRLNWLAADLRHSHIICKRLLRELAADGYEVPAQVMAA